MPVSAERHSSQQELAVLTRANHDMRSPLSVILGVFELLEDAASLTDSERRYLQLGMQAAGELLNLADGLRLYSAMERNLVTLDATPVNLWEMASEQLTLALGARGVDVPMAKPIRAGVPALGDEGYLKIALANLARHLVSNVRKTDGLQPIAIAVVECIDDEGRVALEVAPEDRDTSADTADAAEPDESDQDELAVVNGVRLIELMGGSVSLASREPCLSITLPAAEPSRPR